MAAMQEATLTTGNSLLLYLMLAKQHRSRQEARCAEVRLHTIMLTAAKPKLVAAEDAQQAQRKAFI